MLVVAVPPGEVAAVLAQIPCDRTLLIESPLGVDSTCDPAHRPNAMLGANLLHAPIARRALAAINELDEPHHLLLQAAAPRPAWHSSNQMRNGVSLDLGGRLLPVLLAAAAQPVVEVGATMSYRHEVEVGTELDLRIADSRMLRARLRWDDGPASANLEAADNHAVVSVDLWPYPTLEINGDETDSAKGSEVLHALGFVAQLRRLSAVAAKQAQPWPGLASGVGALRIIEAAELSARSGQTQRLL